MGTGNNPHGWIELPKPATPIPSNRTPASSQHIEAVRSRLSSLVARHRDVYNSSNPLRATPFPLLRAFEETVNHSPDFIRVIAHLLAGKHNSTVLYVVAYGYDDALFPDVGSSDERSLKAIRTIIEIANCSDLANNLSVLIGSRAKQDSLRNHVRMSVWLEREYQQSPSSSMLELVDEIGYDEVQSLITRYGVLEPSRIRGIREGIAPALSDGAL